MSDPSAVPAYERDPRLTRLDTEVVATGEDDGRAWVILADTVLFPEGGGQPADRGTVAGVPVVDVRKVDGRIRHLLAGAAPSGEVRVELEWARRLDHMQQHTGQHLLSAVADERYGWHTTAFHLGDRISDIELDVTSLSPAQITELEDAVAAEIRAARPVTIRRVAPDVYAGMTVRSRGLPEGHTGDVRLVEIEGIDVNTCGGTHCASTADIEGLGLLGTEPMRGGTRLTWVAGVRLRRLLAEHHGRSAELRALLGTSDDELVARTAAKLEQLKGAERALHSLEDELATASAAALAGGAESVLVAHWDDRPLPFLQRVAREVAGAAPDRIVFLTSGGAEEGAFVLTAGEAATLDVADAGRRIAELLGGRGGGSGRVFQGKAGQVARRHEAVALLQRLAAG